MTSPEMTYTKVPTLHLSPEWAAQASLVRMGFFFGAALTLMTLAVLWLCVG